MLDDGSLEIVASLRNGDFNNIRVVSDKGSCQSDTVPYDNALNYRSGNVDIVAFGGAKADSIGALVARSIDIPVRLEYVGGKGVAGSIQLSHDQKEMIAATWRIVDMHRNLNRTERMLPLYNEKIRVLKSRLD